MKKKNREEYEKLASVESSWMVEPIALGPVYRDIAYFAKTFGFKYLNARRVKEDHDVIFWKII